MSVRVFKTAHLHDLLRNQRVRYKVFPKEINW